MEIAIFGGTFDPPTRAHQAIIAALSREPRFDQVWIMPSGQRTDKPHMTPDELRLKLLQAALVDYPDTIATDFEMNLPQPTQTIQTYQLLRSAYPGHRFRYVFGADSYHDMPNWEQGRYLQTQLPMVLIERSGHELPQQTEQVWHLRVERIVQMGISSTAVRSMVATGMSVDDMVCPGVYALIAEHGLYQPTPARGIIDTCNL
jgi:nicotinate-nucleotide adenylyltransferase